MNKPHSIAPLSGQPKGISRISIIVPVFNEERNLLSCVTRIARVKWSLPTYHRLINRTLSLLSNLASGIYVTDMETCYKVFRADVI